MGSGVGWWLAAKNIRALLMLFTAPALVRHRRVTFPHHEPHATFGRHEHHATLDRPGHGPVKTSTARVDAAAARVPRRDEWEAVEATQAQRRLAAAKASATWIPRHLHCWACHARRRWLHCGGGGTGCG